ncbi:DivIVA domain-containing protein [Modestobacter sp. NPDC049651]|uniref:DivIVA domain-containing protein n=1 Tax=unclassified Modestobacter TaxID=2643866 RepID=UPI0034116EEA
MAGKPAEDSAPAAEAARSAARRGRGLRRPNLSGDLETMLEPGPLFRDQLRGYDRLQVDNYVSWAETELQAVRRENDDLAARLGSASAELSAARRKLAHSTDAQHLGRVSERIGQILQLAADEAAEIAQRAAEDADRVVAEAHAEGERVLRAARDQEARTNAECERLLGEAERLRAEAAALLEQAGVDAVQRERDAAADRARRDAEAAQRRDQELADARRRAQEERDAAQAVAEQRLAEVRAEVGELLAQRDRVQSLLRALTEQLDAALQQLAPAGTPEPRRPNVVADTVDIRPNSVAPQAATRDAAR